MIDRRFFREAYNAQEILTELHRVVRRLSADPQQLLQTVAERISASLYPDHTAVFIRGLQVNGSTLQRDGDHRLLAPLKSASNEDYCCHWIKTRAGHKDQGPFALSEADSLSLPADSFVARHLETTATGESEALEVYLDDPRSWVCTLAKADASAKPLYQERLLLERLNTRLIVPLVTNNRVLGFISLGEKLSEEPYSRNDKELLETVGEQTAIALDYARLIREVAEQEKLKRELEIAKQVQSHLFPQVLPPMRSLDFVGVCKAARGVGGDYYDFLHLTPGKLGIALGDISGKGISAALLMASLQAMLRSNAPVRGEAVDELFGDMNRLLCQSTGKSKYATVFYGLYDESRRTLTYVNGGHNPPMLFRIAYADY